MYSPSVYDNCTLRIVRSWLFLYRGCDDFIHLSASWHIVTKSFSSSAFSGRGDIVAVLLVSKAVRLSKAVGPRVCRDKTRLNGDKLVDLSIWALYAYVNGCTYMSQFLLCSWCSGTQYWNPANIVLLKWSAFPLGCWWYPILFRCLVPKKVHKASKTFLVKCVLLSVKSHSRVPYRTTQLFRSNDAIRKAVILKIGTDLINFV